MYQSLFCIPRLCCDTHVQTQWHQRPPTKTQTPPAPDMTHNSTPYRNGRVIQAVDFARVSRVPFACLACLACLVCLACLACLPACLPCLSVCLFPACLPAYLLAWLAFVHLTASRNSCRPYLNWRRTASSTCVSPCREHSPSAQV